VWKRIIGTKLHLSQQDFDNFVQHNGDYFNDKKVAITTIIEEEVQDAGATNATREQVSTPSSSPQPSSQVQQQQRQQLYDYYVPSELVFDVDPDMEAQFQQAQKAFWGNSTNDSDNNGDTDNANTATVPAPDATTQRQDRDLRTSMFASSRVFVLLSFITLPYTVVVVVVVVFEIKCADCVASCSLLMNVELPHHM
jgi:hypothetical protein